MCTIIREDHNYIIITLKYIFRVQYPMYKKIRVQWSSVNGTCVWVCVLSDNLLEYVFTCVRVEVELVM